MVVMVVVVGVQEVQEEQWKEEALTELFNVAGL